MKSCNAFMLHRPSKKINMQAGAPLTNCSVLVTRPRHQANELMNALSDAGASPILLPSIDIQALPDAQIQSQIATIEADSLVIFISQNAVEYAWPWLRQQFPEQLPTLAAVGASTAKALHACGVVEVIYPPAPPYNSETLLACPALQQVASRPCYVIRGVGGRELLAETLQQRGADLGVIEVYQRACPTPDPALLARLWQQQPVDVVISTSREALGNLCQLLPASLLPRLFATPLLVISDAMADQAHSLGFAQVHVATGADTPSIMQALALLNS